MNLKLLAINSFSLLVVIQLLPGIVSTSILFTILAALVLGFLNNFIKPVLLILTIPLNIVTLGLFTFVINGCLLYLTAGLVPGFAIYGFGSAIFGSIIFSLASMITRKIVEK